MVDKKGKRPRAAAEEEAGPAGRVAMKELRVIQQELEKVVLLRLSEMPNFWLSMLLRHPKLENVLMFSNQKIFNYFESVNVEELEVPINGYCIKFDTHSNRIIWKATKANAEAREKISEVMENCMAKQNAIYKRRNEIIKGIPHFWLRVVSMGVIIQVNAEAKEKISEIRMNCPEKREAIFDRRNEIIKGIPDLWMRVFLNHCMLKILVSPKDREVLIDRS